jgi:hypothetical protein
MSISGSLAPFYGLAIGFFPPTNYYGITYADDSGTQSAFNSLSWWNGPYGGNDYSGFARSFDDSSTSGPWFYSQELDSAASNWNGSSAYGPGYSFGQSHYDSTVSDYGLTLTPFYQITTSHLALDVFDSGFSQIGPNESDWLRDYHLDATAVTYSAPGWTQTAWEVDTSLTQQNHSSGPGFDETTITTQADQVMHLFSTVPGGFTEADAARHQAFDFTTVDTPQMHLQINHSDQSASASSISISPALFSETSNASHDTSDYFVSIGAGRGVVADSETHSDSHQSLLVIGGQQGLPVVDPVHVLDSMHGFFAV